MANTLRFFLRRLTIQNYRSIGRCDVSFSPLTILIGRNAAGKSNFLDALSFVADSLSYSLDHALRARGGFGEVRRKSGGRPRNLAIELELLVGDHTAKYGFELAAGKDGSFQVKKERARIGDAKKVHEFIREGKGIRASTLKAPLPTVAEDRLYLVTLSGFPEFRPIYDAIIGMGFYNFEPKRMRELVSPDAGELLQRDGRNIASVVARLKTREPALFERICEYLGRIVPGVSAVERAVLGPSETVLFKQGLPDSKQPWKFYASSMSDGTLRVLGTLVAAAQLSQKRQLVSLIGIEEPETALHPAAAGMLMEALRELGQAQIIMTTHSPDLLDQAEVGSDHTQLLAVENVEGETRLGTLDGASLTAIKDHLFGAGELLRLDQLQPDPADLRRQQQLRLFEE